MATVVYMVAQDPTLAMHSTEWIGRKDSQGDVWGAGKQDWPQLCARIAGYISAMKGHASRACGPLAGRAPSGSVWFPPLRAGHVARSRCQRPCPQGTTLVRERRVRLSWTPRVTAKARNTLHDIPRTALQWTRAELLAVLINMYSTHSIDAA